jgi:hypothetical protein
MRHVALELDAATWLARDGEPVVLYWAVDAGHRSIKHRHGVRRPGAPGDYAPDVVSARPGT